MGVSAIQEILILKPSSLGDIVHTLPAVHAVHLAHPSARIRWLSNPEWAPLLRNNGFVDEVIEFPRNQFRGITGPFRGMQWMFRQRRLAESGIALDFQGLLRSALIGRFMKPQKFAGLSDAREGSRWFYDEVVDVSGCAHSVDRYFALARSVGATKPPVSEMVFPLPSGLPPAGFETTPGYIIVHPFARGAGKSLPPDSVLKLCELLQPQRVVLVGRGGDLGRLPENTENLINKTDLLELLHVIRHAAFTISVDSGPMHLAAACSSRVVAIHTWSDPRKVGPYSEDAWVWKSGRLARVRDGGFVEGGAESHLPRPRDLEAIAQLAHEQMAARHF